MQIKAVEDVWFQKERSSDVEEIERPRAQEPVAEVAPSVNRMIRTSLNASTDSQAREFLPVSIQSEVVSNFSIRRSSTSAVGPNLPRSIFDSCP